MGQSVVFREWPTQNWKFSSDSAIYFLVVMAQGANPWVCDPGLAVAPTAIRPADSGPPGGYRTRLSRW